MGIIVYWQKYINSFGVEYNLQEVLKKIRDKSISHNIFRIDTNDFIMCGCYYISSFSLNDGEKMTKVLSSLCQISRLGKEKFMKKEVF